MSTLKVHGYSGYKADQRPTSFEVDDERLTIKRILDQWRDPDAEYFRALASDGKVYLLKHTLMKDEWELEKDG